MNVDHLKVILNQYGGPIHLSYQTKSISGITESLVDFHALNIDNLKHYKVSELYSLYGVIDYALKDLGDEEFNTVTGLDLYEDGYTLLNLIKKEILEK